MGKIQLVAEEAVGITADEDDGKPRLQTTHTINQLISAYPRHLHIRYQECDGASPLDVFKCREGAGMRNHLKAHVVKKIGGQFGEEGLVINNVRQGAMLGGKVMRHNVYVRMSRGFDRAAEPV